MAVLWFEDYSLGQSFTTRGRTITEADVTAFSGLSGDFNPLHTDEQFAKKSRFGRRIAHGVLVLAICTGLNQQLGIYEGSILLGLEWTFKHPVFFGDTIHFKQTVRRLHESSNPEYGIVEFEGSVINQEDVIVQSAMRRMMIKRRESKQ